MLHKNRIRKRIIASLLASLQSIKDKEGFESIVDHVRCELLDLQYYEIISQEERYNIADKFYGILDLSEITNENLMKFSGDCFKILKIRGNNPWKKKQ